MSSPEPTRQSDSLADVVELVLDKGVVINADIAVSIGDTELLGIQLRAALASFETAAKYGLEFPEGTDMQRVAAAAEAEEIATSESQTSEMDESDATTVQTEINQLDEINEGIEAEDSESDTDSDSDKQSAPEPTQQSTGSSEDASGNHEVADDTD